MRGRRHDIDTRGNERTEEETLDARELTHGESTFFRVLSPRT